jgi:hypothetical protein
VVPHLIQGGVTHLQYTYDTMILIDPSDEGIANLKLILLAFEDMPGLKINFNKSEVVVLGRALGEQTRLVNLLNWLGQFPITYLGLPVSNKRLRVSDWEVVTGKVSHRVDPWQGLFVASTGRGSGGYNSWCVWPRRTRACLIKELAARRPAWSWRCRALMAGADSQARHQGLADNALDEAKVAAQTGQYHSGEDGSCNVAAMRAR